MGVRTLRKRLGSCDALVFATAPCARKWRCADGPSKPRGAPFRGSDRDTNGVGALRCLGCPSRSGMECVLIKFYCISFYYFSSSVQIFIRLPLPPPHVYVFGAHTHYGPPADGRGSGDGPGTATGKSSHARGTGCPAVKRPCYCTRALSVNTL